MCFDLQPLDQLLLASQARKHPPAHLRSVAPPPVPAPSPAGDAPLGTREAADAATLQLRISVAASTDKLDLADCGLEEVPSDHGGAHRVSGFAVMSRVLI